jgi:Domain of unknown function (DUF4349)
MQSEIATCIGVVLLLLTSGCHRAYSARGPVAPALPTPPDSRPALVGGICDLDRALCSAGAFHDDPLSAGGFEVTAAHNVNAEVYAAQTSGGGSLLSFGGGSPAPRAPDLPSAGSHGPREMIEVEARFAIKSDNLARSASRFRDIARESGGSITLDTESLSSNASEATFEVRVPMAQYDSIVAALESVGSVRAREVKATDIAKQYRDEELLLANQEAAMKRYEELLRDAKNVTEVMAVEGQLDRLRAQIDRLKGDMAWMQDKVARATIRVRILASDAAAEAISEPSVALYPGLRFVTIVDLRGDSQRFGYVGGGLSLAFKDVFGIHFGRAFVLEVDLAHAAFGEEPSGSHYAFLALAGSDFYSDLLGGGRRRLLNPFLGWRAGYGESEARGDLALGGILGLDLVKTKTVFVDLHVRALGLVGNGLGPHAVVAPGLGANVAF